MMAADPPRNLLQSIRLLADGSRSFTKNCVVGIKANEKKISQIMNESLMLATCLNSVLGYDDVAAIAKNAHKKGITLRESALESGKITGEEFDKRVRPERKWNGGCDDRLLTRQSCSAPTRCNRLGHSLKAGVHVVRMYGDADRGEVGGLVPRQLAAAASTTAADQLAGYLIRSSQFFC